MSKIKRGEIWSGLSHTRDYVVTQLIVTREETEDEEGPEIVTVQFLRGKSNHILEVEVDGQAIGADRAVVMLNTMNTIPISNLKEKMGCLSPEDLEKVLSTIVNVMFDFSQGSKK